MIVSLWASDWVYIRTNESIQEIYLIILDYLNVQGHYRTIKQCQDKLKKLQMYLSINKCLVAGGASGFFFFLCLYWWFARQLGAYCHLLYWTVYICKHEEAWWNHIAIVKIPLNTGILCLLVSFSKTLVFEMHCHWVWERGKFCFTVLPFDLQIPPSGAHPFLNKPSHRFLFRLESLKKLEALCLWCIQNRHAIMLKTSHSQSFSVKKNADFNYFLNLC